MIGHDGTTIGQHAFLHVVDRVLKGVFAEMGEEPERKEIVGYADDALIPLEPESGMHMPHVFVGNDGKRQRPVLHIGRAVRAPAPEAPTTRPTDDHPHADPHEEERR